MHTGINTVARLPLALALACLVASPLLPAIEIEQRSLSSTEAVAKPAPAPAPAPAPVQPAPAAPATPALVVKAVVPAPAASNPAWDMFQQLEEMRGSIAKLQGTVEEQQQLIERLQSDLRTRYTDLDQRLEQLAKPVPPAATVTIPAIMPAAEATAAPVTEAPAPKAAPAPAEITPEELNRQKSAYLSAYQSFRRDGAVPAIAAMTRFLDNFPDSVFAPNAYYWLGEFQLALEPANLISAEANFQRVLRDYSASPKVASAYYKLGTIADLQGKRKSARDWMTKLISEFPNSQEARLAQSFLDQNPAK